ncbi:MAG TPA: hypothetical protein VNT22_01385, partial [Baekduia sp.]|nr:hypothetical protein [Baekduia sp.]
ADGGPTEIISDGVDGVLSRFGDPVALATNITSLLQDRDFARSIAQAGQRRAADFTPRRFAEAVAAGVIGAASQASSVRNRR